MKPEDLSSSVLTQLLRHQLRQQERVRRFGHIRPQISTDFAGYKFVAVGPQLHYGKWKTFHDFLFYYIASVFGSEWGNPELAKPFEERHPVAQWYHRLCEFQARHIESRDERGIYNAVVTGPVMAYLALAYDLYTLRHHSLLQAKLVERLKDKRQFQGARYETYVASGFVKAGFDVKLEDEADRTTTHCEFTATHQATGSKFSVEAKSRHRTGFLGHPGQAKPLDEIEADVSGLLAKALRKQADHERIIFIDVNVPADDRPIFEADWATQIARQVELLERQPVTVPWPPAFLFFTNHPYHYVGNDAPEPRRDFLATAINVTDFKPPYFAPSIIVRKYRVIRELFESIMRHAEVPSEFEEPPS